MKKIFFIIPLFLLFMLLGCNNENIDSEPINNDPVIENNEDDEEKIEDNESKKEEKDDKTFDSDLPYGGFH